MLSVNESGSGTPLVMLHGWGLHSGVWEKLLPALEQNFHCYTVDMLGHGESQADSTDFSLINMREALHAVITTIKDDNIILFGWSLGGMVVMDYLQHYSKKIKQCILVASNACFCKKGTWVTGVEESVVNNFAKQLEQDHKKTVDKFMALQLLGAQSYKQSLKELKQSMLSRTAPSIQALQEGLAILKSADLRAGLNKIIQPVYMIVGEHDKLMPYQAAEKMQLLFKNAEYIMIKGASHAPFISHPKEFITAINYFSQAKKDNLKSR